jgi:hypothetical protein
MPSSNVPWSPPLQRLNPWYPGQIGVSGAWTDTGLRLDTNGTVFYVDPNAVGVSDQRDGTDPTEPLQTVAAALTKCEAYKGDVIAVMANSFWTYAARVNRVTPIYEEVTVTTPGVRIMGLFPSSSMGVPWMPVNDNGVCITVHAMDVLIEGFTFWDSMGVTAPVGIRAEWGGGVYGENLTVRNCWFGEGLDYGIQLDWSWNNQIHDNIFQNVAVAAIYSIDVLGDPDYATIRDNLFMNNGNAIDLEDVDHCAIYRNAIFGDDGGTDNFIDLTGGSNNLVFDNWLGCTLAAGQYNATCSDATSGMWIRNHCIDGETGAPPT